jgi:hypothetical protein
VRGFTKGDVLRLLNTCWPNGYKLVAFKGSNFYPLPASAARIAARAFPTAAVALFFLFRKQRQYTGEFLEHPVELETNFYIGHDRHHVTA